MNLTKEFRQKARQALLEGRGTYSGSDTAFAQTFGISASVFSRIKKGETESVLSDAKWLTIGREYNVTLKNFFIKLIGDVASINAKVQAQVPTLVKKCVGKEKTLRHLRTLIQMSA